MPSNSERTTRARPVGETGRGTVAGATSAGRAGVAVLARAGGSIRSGLRGLPGGCLLGLGRLDCLLPEA
eukprot:974514-Alexandrium_andersonii.AAC.1